MGSAHHLRLAEALPVHLHGLRISSGMGCLKRMAAGCAACTVARSCLQTWQTQGIAFGTFCALSHQAAKRVQQHQPVPDATHVSAAGQCLTAQVFQHLRRTMHAIATHADNVVSNRLSLQAGMSCSYGCMKQCACRNRPAIALQAYIPVATNINRFNYPACMYVGQKIHSCFRTQAQK